MKYEETKYIDANEDDYCECGRLKVVSVEFHPYGDGIAQEGLLTCPNCD